MFCHFLIIFHGVSIVQVALDLDTHKLFLTILRPPFFIIFVDLFHEQVYVSMRMLIFSNASFFRPPGLQLALSKTRTSMNHFFKNHKPRINLNVKRTNQQYKAERNERSATEQKTKKTHWRTNKPANTRSNKDTNKDKGTGRSGELKQSSRL